MKKLFFALFLVLVTTGQAQNLVPNGSFETFSSCPSSSGQIYRAIGWFQPNKYPGGTVNSSSSSDYFYTCSPPFIDVPKNVAGYQYPNTGNGYIGIAYYGIFSNGNGSREYAEVELNQSLIAGIKYNLKYFVSLANQSPFSIIKFDCYFSSDSLLYSSTDLLYIPVSPQVQYSSRINDTLSWTEINGSFIADGGERFLTLGNFHSGSVSDTLRNPIIGTTTLGGGSYYYIDDVSLVEDSTTGINEAFKFDFLIYPNPTKDIVLISSQEIIAEIVLFDIQQKNMLVISPKTSKTQIDLSQIANGIYIVQCRFKNGELIYRKLAVQH